MEAITIKIEAPEIVNAINSFLKVISNQQSQSPVAAAQKEIPVSMPTAIPTAPANPVQQPVQMPTAERTYSLEELSLAGVSLVDQGKKDALISLLAEFNVQAVTQLPVSNYGAFATKLRAMGAKI